VAMSDLFQMNVGGSDASDAKGALTRSNDAAGSPPEAHAGGG